MDYDNWKMFTSTGQLDAYMRYKESESKHSRIVGRRRERGAEPMSDWDFLHMR